MARWLAESGVGTVYGKEWRTPTLRGLLLNPRIYGVRVHQGKPLGPGGWEPIISPEDGERLRLLLSDPARRTNRTARRYALSGVCRCALCGTVMYSVPRYETRRYLCRSGHDFGGCGKMAVAAEPLEKLITDAVLYRLDSPDLAQALAGTGNDNTDTAALHEMISADAAKMEELAEMWSENAITGPERRTARQGVEQRLTANRKTLSRLRGTSVIDGLVGNGADLAARWETLNLTRQVAIINAVVDPVRIHPSTTPGIRHLDTARVEIIWRR